MLRRSCSERFASSRANLCPHENDTAFEFRMLAPGDERAAAEHEALWPLKRIPVLVDEGRTVLEASIIILVADQIELDPVLQECLQAGQDDREAGG